MNKEKIINLKEEIRNSFNEINDINSLNDLKVKYLGKKGIITDLSSMMREIPNEEKKEFGMLINEVRVLFSELYEQYKNEMETKLINEKLEKEAIDVTLPSTKIKRGSKHPLTRVVEELED